MPHPVDAPDRADLVVVGGGIAGLVAANRAADLGLTCVVLEKGEDRYLCNSRITSGMFHVCFKDITSPPERLLAAIHAEVPDVASPALARAIAEHAGRALAWLRQRGVRVIRALPDEAFRWVLAPPRLLRIGESWEGRGGDVMLRTLEESLVRRGGALLRGARAMSLELSGGACTGVTASVAGRRRTFGCGAALIADGGFQADAELVRRHISPEPGSLFPRGAATGCGDGIRMAEALGARLVGMDAFYGHVLSRSVFGNPDLWPYPVLDRVITASIVVDSSGARFMDEGRGRVYQANRIARLADPLSAVAIMDDAIWQSVGRAFMFPPNPHLVQRGGVLLSAPDVASLARVAGLPADALQRTVSGYNDALGRGEPGRLAPPRSADKFPPMPIATPPFHAIPLAAGITYTMGGIAIDDGARVLDDRDRPIPGLYAAGSATGGLEGGETAGYVGGLVKAAVTALLAAETAARATGRPVPA